MAKIWIGLTVAAVVLGTKLIGSHPAMPDTLQGREDFLAQGVNKAAPIAIAPYLTMTGAKVADGALEIDLAQSSSAPKITMEDAFRRGLAFGTCKDSTFSDLIKRGGSIRLAITTSDGVALAPVTISSADCPNA